MYDVKKVMVMDVPGKKERKRNGCGMPESRTYPLKQLLLRYLEGYSIGLDESISNVSH